MVDSNVLPRVLSVYLSNKKSPPKFGNILEVKLQRRCINIDPMEEDISFNDQWIVEPNMSVAILSIDSFNMSSKVYEISSTDTIATELNSGVMIIVDNPDDKTVIKFPKLYPIDENETRNTYEDTILIKSYYNP
jgi:hypothetical protein